MELRHVGRIKQYRTSLTMMQVKPNKYFELKTINVSEQDLIDKLIE